MELFEGIRRDQREEGLSIRALAERHEVHRRTVRQALGDATPPERKVPVRVSPVTGEHVLRVRTWLAEDLAAPPKQRHTARRVWQRLTLEHGAVLAESTVRVLVAQVRAEQRAARLVVPIVQEHPAGAQAEVDFGEFRTWIGGVYVKLWMFALRLSHSGRAVHVAYANQAQESFLDGHVRAFAVLGGVPAGQVRYDNLRPAVVRVLLGRERLQNPRFVALRSHYGYDAFFCEPGIGGAHEKGGVEGEIGRFRRRHLTPVPVAVSLAELNEQLAAADLTDQDRRVAARSETVGQAAQRERASLRPLPAEAFDASTALSCRVDSKARICVRQSYYSVPARLAGGRVSVALGARELVVRDARTGRAGQVVARHVRSLHKNTQDLQLDHYLEVLARRPGALPAATALVTARASGLFTATHDRFWAAARRAHGDSAGTKLLIEVLLLHRTLAQHAVLAGIDAALRLERTDPQLVAVEARRHLEPHRDTTAPAPAPATASASAHACGIVGVETAGSAGRAGSAGPTSPPQAGDERTQPSLTGYDALLPAATAGLTA